MAWLARPPGLPPLVEGFLNLRGEVVPVLRLERLFGVAAKPPELHTPILVLRGSGGALAWMVDRVSEVTEIPEARLTPVRGEHCWNECTRAQTRLGDQVVHVLDPDRLLLEAERQRLAELRATAEQFSRSGPHARREPVAATEPRP